MKNLLVVFMVAALAGVAVFGLTRSASSEEGFEGAVTAAKIAELMDQAKISLADAVKTAEARVEGRACAGRIELDDEGLVFEVLVVTKGEKPALFEVEIDAKTGKVIEVEGEDDDDDDDDDEDDEDDD